MSRHRNRIAAVGVGIALGLVVSLGSGGCARHVHHHHEPPPPKKVVVLEKEHTDRKIVVVYKRPAPSRHCWRHGAHWHCRAH